MCNDGEKYQVLTVNIFLIRIEIFYKIIEYFKIRVLYYYWCMMINENL